MLGNRITECPQAGLRRAQPQPLDRRQKDEAERVSERGDDIRTNQDYSCFPQNETSVAINPRAQRNLLTTQNDYRTLSRQGFGSSTNRGRNWYDGELPPLSAPDGDILDASGDPVSVFDRAGVAYSSSINFNRTDDTNGITVQRSTNGGFTWTRPCVPIPSDTALVCGGPGDPRQPGDGVVTHFDDPDEGGPALPPFDDKEWLAAGPRPDGVTPQCFTPAHAPTACDPDVVGVDRLYVTWTRFDDDAGAVFGFTAKILLSYSDDQARSWSAPRAISGGAAFCGFSLPAGTCDLNQFSVPTVHPKTGLLGVAFENFNTPDENQYLFVRSTDGAATFAGPFFITPVFDLNYPTAGTERPDCTQRGQQAGRDVLTNSCFRVNSGGNVAVDKRDGDFADDFYIVMSDNRNGTNGSSNTDVFFFRSTNGGTTWIGPTRVNTDRSDLGGVLRDSAQVGDFGNDQWFPWADINGRGVLAVGFHDRRLDTESTASEWPTSRQRPGNYLAWFWGPDVGSRRPRRSTRARPRSPLGPGNVSRPGRPSLPSRPHCRTSLRAPSPGRGRRTSGPSRTTSSRMSRTTSTTRSGPASSWVTTTQSPIRTCPPARAEAMTTTATVARPSPSGPTRGTDVARGVLRLRRDATRPASRRMCSSTSSTRFREAMAARRPGTRSSS
jgi:hypothetical protein